MPTSDGINSGSEAGAAEKAVARLRDQLRSAGAYRRVGKIAESNFKEAEANHGLEEICYRLRGRFERHARAWFSNGPEETVEDAIQEMVLMLCGRLRDLSPRHQLLEARFNLCIKRLCIDACRRISRENCPPPDGYQVVSIDDPLIVDDADSTPTRRGDLIEDPAAAQRIRRVIGDQLGEVWLRSLPSDRHREVVVAHAVEGATWDKVAERLGICEKTARNYYNEARQLLREMASAQRKEEDLL